MKKNLKFRSALRTMRYGVTRVLLAMILALLLFGANTARSQAASGGPIDLELGGSGATSWTIGNLKPGDSGTKTVELHNAGTKPGFVSIWVSDAVSSEGTNPESETGNTAEPGELDKNLMFGLSSNRSRTTLALPTTIGNLPTSATARNSIEIIPLKAGETVSIEWTWSLPDLTNNDNQGDSISFTLDYLLREMDISDLSGQITPAGVFTGDTTITPTGTTAKLVIKKDTVAKTSDNQSPNEMWFVEIGKDPYALSATSKSIGSEYEAGPHGTTFDRSITISIPYNVADIPAGANEGDLVIVTWDESAKRWVELSGSIIDTTNKVVSVQINHFSRYKVVAHVPIPVSSPAPSTEPEEELPPTPPEPEKEIPEKHELTIEIGGATRTVETDADGTLRETLKLVDSEGHFIIEVGKGGRIVSEDGTPVSRLEISRTETPVKIPDNMLLLSPLYKVTGFVDGRELPVVYFFPYANLSILYNPKDLPENTLTPFVASYTEATGWTALEPPANSIFEIGKAGALAFYASWFAVMAEQVPPPPPLPAEFIVSNLKVSPEVSQVHNPVIISVTIENTGAVSGSHEVYLIIDGIVRAIKEITLDANSIQKVSFEVSDLSPGKHQVKISDLTAEFRIIETASTLPEELSVGWAFADFSLGVIIITLLFALYLFLRRSKLFQYGNVATEDITKTIRRKNDK